MMTNQLSILGAGTEDRRRDLCGGVVLLEIACRPAKGLNHNEQVQRQKSD